MREEPDGQRVLEQPAHTDGGEALSDDAIERLRRERFGERVQRVLAVMREERVDWRGVAFVTPDGRIAVQVTPMPMQDPEGAPSTHSAGSGQAPLRAGPQGPRGR